MKVVYKIVWYVFGGALMGVLCFIEAGFCYLTIGLIPVGHKLVEAGLFFFRPKGKALLSQDIALGQVVRDAIWSLLLGWVNFLLLGLIGVIYCASVVGISIGLQYFKMARFIVSPLYYELRDSSAEEFPLE